MKRMFPRGLRTVAKGTVVDPTEEITLRDRGLVGRRKNLKKYGKWIEKSYYSPVDQKVKTHLVKERPYVRTS